MCVGVLGGYGGEARACVRVRVYVHTSCIRVCVRGVRAAFAAAERSLDIYGEKPGGLELCGIFTVYSQEAYDSLSQAQIGEVRTAPRRAAGAPRRAPLDRRDAPAATACGGRAGHS